MLPSGPVLPVYATDAGCLALCAGAEAMLPVIQL